MRRATAPGIRRRRSWTCGRTGGLVLTGLGALASLGAEEAAPGAPGWHFAAKQAHVYLYQVTQETDFASAGDLLHYTATLSWTLALAPRPGDARADHVDLGVTIMKVTATLDGPASHHAIDTSNPSSAALHDAVFGHLFALQAKGFIISCDPRTGTVSAVSGGDAVAEDIAERSPSAFGPGEPSPLAAAARTAYGSQVLCELWTQLLTVPRQGDQSVPLAAPLSGALVRHWLGSGHAGEYQMSLPAGVDHLPVTLGSGPMQVTGTLSEVAGSGSVTPHNGVPGTARGSLSFTLSLSALTQPVVEHQHVSWTLTDVPL